MVNKQNYTLCFLRTGGNGSRPRSVNIRGLTMDRGHSNSAWLSGRKVKGSVHPNHEKSKCHVLLACASKSPNEISSKTSLEKNCVPVTSDNPLTVFFFGSTSLLKK